MTEPQSSLNQTSRHVLALFTQAKSPLPWPDSQPLLNLLVWAQAQAMAPGPWLQAVVDAAVKLDATSPETLQVRLSEASGLEQARTLREAAKHLLAFVVDLIPPQTSPA